LAAVGFRAAGFIQASEPEAASLSLIRQEQSKHLAVFGTDRWHAIGYRGQGMKIAVIDTGFRGYHNFLGKTLPSNVRTRCFRDDGNFEAKNSQHGILCAEVLHTIAPDAELMLATWEPDSPESFLKAVSWAKVSGARIISCSIIMPSWSDGNGGGEFHRKLKQILLPSTSVDSSFNARTLKQVRADGSSASTDTLFFACAGNTALRHWAGMFHRGADGFQEWAAGQTVNRVQPWGRDRVSVELYGPAESQYEIIVRDEKDQEVARSHPFPSTKGPSVAARFMPQPQSTYQAQVRLTRGKPSNFHLVVLGGYLGTVTSQGSVACPADGSEVIAVGAVTSGGRRLEYSSCGVDFQTVKPDFVAPVPFPTTIRSQAFSGTSAAAPQAAGLAAVLWSRHPTWSAEEVHAALIKSARDVGPPGPDSETGFGMIRLP
jgi:subtilisin family serine protease